MIRKVTFLYRQQKLTNAYRFISNAQRKPIRNHHDFKILKESDMAPFMAYYPKIRADASHEDAILNYPPVNRRFERLLDYILPCGKLGRQHILIHTYKKIEEYYGAYSEEKLEDIYKLAWCLEMLCAQFIIVDDITDNHEIRRGKLAWHQQKDIGMSAVLDSYLLQFSMFSLLKKYFSQHLNYTKILENFLRLEMSTGCLLEVETNTFEDFTLERSYEIGQTKTAYFLFGQPFELATLLADKGLHMNNMVGKVFHSLGWLYNLQNDMLDCYGEELTGKPGADIQNNRCTGLITLAILKASPKQSKILAENYGSCDKGKIDKVKQIYDELKIPDEYFRLEKILQKRILNEIQNIPDPFARYLVENYAYVSSYGEIGIPPTS